MSEVCNASVTPAGLVQWYTGMFAAAETDDEIASVLSHEIAHVLAHHGQAESSEAVLGALVISPTLPFLLGGLLIGELMWIAAPPIEIATTILLALSRSQEAEADKIGMLLMAEAGFEPRAAVTYWEKMDRIERKIWKTTGKKPDAEYRSTHPHSASRLSQAAADIPSVLYTVDKGPLPPGMSQRRLRRLEKSKQRWKAFLEEKSNNVSAEQAIEHDLVVHHV
ncbi:MAG: hypothetical protein Q9168_006662 [Polycauliona sp. 1 TL-2023]